MANPVRNEMEITLGGQTILLRPTFENIAALEENVGPVSYLAWLFGGGFVREAKGLADSAKKLPPLTKCAQIIYYCQAGRKDEDPNERKYNLEEIWEMVQSEGMAVTKPMLTFIARITAGNKMALSAEQMTESQKKSF